MIFLIEYNRQRGQIVSFTAFADNDRRQAEDARIELELKLNRANTEHEVVLLEAATEAALRRTHRRYFETLQQLGNDALTELMTFATPDTETRPAPVL